MVRLRNIKKNDDIVSANYYVEHEAEKGFLKINAATGDIVEQKPTSNENEDGLSSYVVHAISFLRSLEKGPDTPTDKDVLWY